MQQPEGDEGRLTDLRIFLDSPMAIDADRDADCRICGDIALRPNNAARCMPWRARPQRGGIQGASTAVPCPIHHRLFQRHGDGRAGVAPSEAVFAPDPNSTILFAGYQAGGTRGAAMVAGADRSRCMAAWCRCAPRSLNLGMLSAHADADEIIAWLKGFNRPPRQTFIVHGEPSASEACAGASRTKSAGPARWRSSWRRWSWDKRRSLRSCRVRFLSGPCGGGLGRGVGFRVHGSLRVFAASAAIL